MKAKGTLIYEVDGKENELSFFTNENSCDDFVTIKVEKVTEPLRVKVSVLPKVTVSIKALNFEQPVEYKEASKIMVNGYETWTESREFTIDECIPPLSKELWQMRNQGDYTFFSYTGEKGVLHSYGYTYIKNGEECEFVGSLEEASGNTIFEHHCQNGSMRIIKECKDLIIEKEFTAFDIIYIKGTEEIVFDSYFNHFEKACNKIGTCTGWTSWYYYYNSITEDIILENLDAFSRRNIPIDVFQIDDGFQKAVGDWLTPNNKFKNGMKHLADKIKSSGYKPGIWVAPFICEKNSDLFNNHVDWVLRDTEGKMVQAGYNSLWSGEYYTLDFYNEDFRTYLRDVFKCILVEWGYEIVKLDFLYAIAAEPRADKTRGQIMREAMNFLREVCGDKIILGCGVPLTAAFGLVEYCRVGSDVALTWEAEKQKTQNFRERNSTINSMISTIGRRGLNGRAFYNDPDVFILRSTNNEMTFNQRYSLFLINLIFGGLVFTSDNINEYSDQEMDIYLSSFPLKDKRIKSVVSNGECHIIEFSIDDREYLAVANLDSKSNCFEIPSAVYFNSKSRSFLKTDKLVLTPYEACCLLKIKDKPYEIIGDDCCVFAASMVEKVRIAKKESEAIEEISIDINSKFVNKGKIYFCVPEEFQGAKYKGRYYGNYDVMNYEGIRYIVLE